LIISYFSLIFERSVVRSPVQLPPRGHLELLREPLRVLSTFPPPFSGPVGPLPPRGNGERWLNRHAWGQVRGPPGGVDGGVEGGVGGGSTAPAWRKSEVGGIVVNKDFRLILERSRGAPGARGGARGGRPQELKMLRNAAICSRRTTPLSMRCRLESNACAQKLSSHPQIARKRQQMSASRDETCELEQLLTSARRHLH
jgi:hypothetical protein